MNDTGHAPIFALAVALVVHRLLVPSGRQRSPRYRAGQSGGRTEWDAVSLSWSDEVFHDNGDIAEDVGGGGIASVDRLVSVSIKYVALLELTLSPDVKAPTHQLWSEVKAPNPNKRTNIERRS